MSIHILFYNEYMIRRPEVILDIDDPTFKPRLKSISLGTIKEVHVYGNVELVERLCINHNLDPGHLSKGSPNHFLVFQGPHARQLITKLISA